MYCNQKYSGAIKGFLIGSLLVFSLMFISSKNQTPKNLVSFDEAVSRIESDNINEVRIKGETAEFFNDEKMSYASGITERQINFLLRQIQTGSNVSVSVAPEARDPLAYLFQILFWLFFLSPPVIVVLLLVIIKKMDAKG